MNFDFHPNAKGHRVIADTVLDSYRALEFGPAGYQVGKGSLRIVGFVNTLRYDSLALQVQIEGTKAQQRVIAVNKVYTTLYGMSQGAHLAAVSCDEAVAAPYTLPHTYLFGCVIDGLTEGTYTLTAVPVAQKDGMVLQANAVKMKFEVTASGEITVAEEDV